MSSWFSVDGYFDLVPRSCFFIIDKYFKLEITGYCINKTQLHFDKEKFLFYKKSDVFIVEMRLYRCLVILDCFRG